ncbi:hypothetical protein DXG01_014261 [Tephrocybe rancida]|nr:hypothetical protein DXG01_014261 [Tephrocybe rancida]
MAATSGRLYLVDAMNDISEVSMDYCSSRSVRIGLTFIEDVEDSEDVVGAGEPSPELPGSRPRPLAPGASEGSTRDIDESHFRYFRRFRVLLEEIEEAGNHSGTEEKGEQDLEEGASPQGNEDPTGFEQPKNSESVDEASQSKGPASSESTEEQSNLKRRSGPSEASNEPSHSTRPASSLSLPDLGPHSGGGGGGGIIGQSPHLRQELNNLASRNGLRVMYEDHTAGPQYAIVWTSKVYVGEVLFRDASDLVPFPYVQFAAGVVIQVLKKIQTVQRNIDAFKELSQKLVDTVITVRDTVRTCSRSQGLPPEFTRRCMKFVEQLLQLQAQINDIVRKNQSWRRFVSSAAVTDAIAQHQEQINDMRSNFTLDVVLRIYSETAEKQRPRHLAATSGLLYLVDAMNDTSSVSMDYCSNPDDFADFVKFRFRKRLGHDMIDRGNFSLSLQEVEGTQRPLQRDPNRWRSLVKPGVTITMDIVVSAQCGILFHVSRAIIEDIEPAGDEDELAPGSQAPPSAFAQTDEAQLKYFRRFRILLSPLDDPQPDTSNTVAHEQEDQGGATPYMSSIAFHGRAGGSRVFFPPTNAQGQRICRHCGTAGRYVNGVCIAKFSVGPLGPETVCERCRPKTYIETTTPHRTRKFNSEKRGKHRTYARGGLCATSVPAVHDNCNTVPFSLRLWEGERAENILEPVEPTGSIYPRPAKLNTPKDVNTIIQQADE